MHMDHCLPAQWTFPNHSLHQLTKASNSIMSGFIILGQVTSGVCRFSLRNVSTSCLSRQGSFALCFMLSSNPSQQPPLFQPVNSSGSHPLSKNPGYTDIRCWSELFYLHQPCRHNAADTCPSAHHGHLYLRPF